MILVGDVFDQMAQLPADSVDCVVTSPPYFGLRNYAVDRQLGLERTIPEYIGHLRMVFDQVRRVLKPSGTLWLNMGDTYVSRGGSSHPGIGVERTRSQRSITGNIQEGLLGLKPKNLIGVPWRLALALQEDGWYLRQDIIWHKPNAMPESVRDRCTKAHEYLFLISKSDKYHFDYKAIQEVAVCGAKGSQFHTGKTGDHQLGRAQKVRPSKPKGSFEAKGEPLPGQLPFRAVREMRQKRSVWSVSTRKFKEAHFATFPPQLIEPCILAGCPEGGVILDPFLGSGTTAIVAERHRRRWIGIELNPEYAEIARRRIEGARV